MRDSKTYHVVTPSGVGSSIVLYEEYMGYTEAMMALLVGMKKENKGVSPRDELSHSNSSQEQDL